MFIEHYVYSFQNLEATQISFSRWMNKHLWCGLVAQSCPTLHDHMKSSPPGSSVHEILQAKILERIAISSSRWSSWTRGWTSVSCFAGRFFTIWATRGAQIPLVDPDSEILFNARKKWAHLGLPGYLVGKTWASNADIVDSIPVQIPFAP